MAGVEESLLKVLILSQREGFTRKLGNSGIRCVVVLNEEIIRWSFMVDFHNVTLTAVVSVFSGERGRTRVAPNSPSEKLLCEWEQDLSPDDSRDCPGSINLRIALVSQPLLGTLRDVKRYPPVLQPL
jgi:hypothetical protein